MQCHHHPRLPAAPTGALIATCSSALSAALLRYRNRKGKVKCEAQRRLVQHGHTALPSYTLLLVEQEPFFFLLQECCCDGLLHLNGIDITFITDILKAGHCAATHEMINHDRDHFNCWGMNCLCEIQQLVLPIPPLCKIPKMDIEHVTSLHCMV